MKTEKVDLRANVCEGYQILLRAEAVLLLPQDEARIREFYEKLADTCIKWATEVHGEELREEFLLMEGAKERSTFRPRRYRLEMRIAHENEYFAAIVCESNLTDQWREPQQSYHRISHVWDLREQTVLPQAQILSRFGMHLSKSHLPFRPDGIYPEGEFIVCFRNATQNAPFVEKKLCRQFKKVPREEKNT